MKKFFLVLFGSCGILLATSFGYLKEDISFKDFSIYKGSKITILKKDDKTSKAKVSGYGNDDGFFYFDKTLYLKIGTIQNKAKELTLNFTLPNDAYVTNSYDVWEEAEELYYEGCTQCHSAQEPEEHTMLEWDALFSAMKDQVQLDDEEKELILRFLQVHAKDGFIEP